MRRGHDVTLFASGDSLTRARLQAPCPQALRLDPDCCDPLASHVRMLGEVYQRGSRVRSHSLSYRLSRAAAHVLHGHADANYLARTPRSPGYRPTILRLSEGILGVDQRGSTRADAQCQLGRDVVPRLARGPLSIRAEAGIFTCCFSAGSRRRNAQMRRSAPRVGPASRCASAPRSIRLSALRDNLWVVASL